MTNWFWSLAVGTRGRVLRNAPDAGGPGGPTDGGVSSDAGPSAPDAGGDPPPDAQAAGRVPDAGDDGDDESLDDDDAGFDPQYHEELKQRDPKAAKKYRNAINRSKAAQPILQTLRTAGIDPRDPRAVAEFIRNGLTPRQPAIAPAPPPAAPAAKTEPERPKWTPLPVDERFDEAPFRDWDLTVPGNKALYEHTKAAHTTRMQTHALANGFATLCDEIERVTKRLDAYEQGGKAKERQAVNQTWREAVDAGAATLKDPDLQDTFRDAVAGAVMREKRAGRTPDAKAITQAVLKRLTRTGQMTGAEAAKVAHAQGIADRNRTAPSRAALAPGGPPGSPTIDRSSERVSDVSRRLARQHGRSFVGIR